jgi:hypothetical protein
VSLRFVSPRFAPMFLVLAAACGDDEGSGTGGGTSGPGGTGTEAASTSTGGETGGGGGAVEVPDICRGGTAWAPGTAIFREATTDWQLDAIGAAGTRLDAVDFDGDGFPDLLVRTGADVQDDFAEGGVRGTWLLRNTGNGTFEDVTESSGFRTPREAGELGMAGDVISFADIDNDGDLDAITGYGDKSGALPVSQNEVLLNDGAGHFTMVPDPGLLNAPGANTPAAVAFHDANHDGFIDVWIPNVAYGSTPQQGRLLYGDGTGVFYDFTGAVGLTTESWGDLDALNEARSHANSWSGAACDLNDDGYAELLTASYGRAPNLLFQATGPGTDYGYVNRSVESGYAYDERTDWSDNESARCWCTINPEDEDCEGVPEPQYIQCNSSGDAFRWNHDSDRELFRLGGNSGATMCADVDNDGDIDLVTTAIVHWDVGSSSDPAELVLNTGEADVRFERPGNDATGLARDYTGQIDWNEGIMTGSVFDFDNDGWLDIYYGGSDYPGQRGFLYHQVSAGQFEQVALEDGIDHHRSHGSAVADFDRDGDLDIVVGHSTARCADDSEGTECYASQQVRFFENTFGQDGNFIALTLEGTTANRSAIGARVRVTANGITQTRDVGGGHGHFGAQDDLTVFFGLGTACEVDVSIRWPDGANTTETMQLKANRRWSVVQGSAAEVATP